MTSQETLKLSDHYAKKTHTHSSSDISDLSALLSNKVDKQVGYRLMSTDEATELSEVSDTYATKRELAEAQIDPSSVDLSGYREKNVNINATEITDSSAYNIINSSANENQHSINTKINSVLGTIQSSMPVTIETVNDNSYANTYVLKQGGTAISPRINIPKDFLIKSCTLETSSANGVPQTGYEKGDKYLDFVINTSDNSETQTHIYVNLKDIIGDGTIIRAKLSDALKQELDGLGTNTSNLKAQLIRFNELIRTYNGQQEITITDLTHLADDLTTFMSNLTQTSNGLSRLKESLQKFSGYLINFTGNLTEFKALLRSEGVTQAEIDRLVDEISLMFEMVQPLQEQIDASQEDISMVQTSMYGSSKDPNDIKPGSLVDTAQTTEKHLYKGASGSGTVTTPASDTLMYTSKEITKTMYAGSDSSGDISTPADGTVMKSLDNTIDSINSTQEVMQTYDETMNDLKVDLKWGHTTPITETNYKFYYNPSIHLCELFYDGPITNNTLHTWLETGDVINYPPQDRIYLTTAYPNIRALIDPLVNTGTSGNTVYVKGSQAKIKFLRTENVSNQSVTFHAIWHYFDEVTQTLQCVSPSTVSIYNTSRSYLQVWDLTISCNPSILQEQLNKATCSNPSLSITNSSNKLRVQGTFETLSNDLTLSVTIPPADDGSTTYLGTTLNINARQSGSNVTIAHESIN